MTWVHYVYAAVVVGGILLSSFVIYPRFQRRQTAHDAAPVVGAAPAIDAETARLVLPDEQRVVSALAQRDVHMIASYVHALRDGRWDDRMYVCRLFEDNLDRDALTHAARAEPANPVPYLLRGFQAHAWAWKARGHGSADQVAGKDWNRFGERMDLAEKDLLQAAALDPVDPTPYAALVAVGCHLDRGDRVVRDHLDQALARDPEHYGALAHYLNYVTAPHWGGSAEQCVGFARRAAAGAPPGSARPMLVLLAHYYVFHHEHAFGDRKRGDAHVANPEVQREVVAAYHASIGHGAHRIARRTTELRNLAAWWFYMIRDRERCAAQLAHIGDAFTDAYWQRLGPPAKQLRAVRAWAGGGRWKEVGW